MFFRLKAVLLKLDQIGKMKNILQHQKKEATHFELLLFYNLLLFSTDYCY